MSQLIVKDNEGNNYIVDDPKLFWQHLSDYHTSKGKANLSLHEESGYYFTVTTKLLEQVNNFIKKK